MKDKMNNNQEWKSAINTWVNVASKLPTWSLIILIALNLVPIYILLKATNYLTPMITISFAILDIVLVIIIVWAIIKKYKKR